MITETEIFARLTALHSALVEKLGAQPWGGGPALSITSAGCSIPLYDKGPYRIDGGMVLHDAKGQTIADTLADADTFVAAMPDPTAKAKHDWHGKLATLIDEGHALALPDDVMQPLRGASQAVHKNLLTAPDDAK